MLGEMEVVPSTQLQVKPGAIMVHGGTALVPLENTRRADVPDSYCDARMAMIGEVVGQLRVIRARPPQKEGGPGTQEERPPIPPMDPGRESQVHLLAPGSTEGDEQQKFYEVLRQLRVFDKATAGGDYERQLQLARDGFQLSALCLDAHRARVAQEGAESVGTKAEDARIVRSDAGDLAALD